MNRVRLELGPLAQAVAVGFALWVLLQIVQRTLWVIVLIVLALLLASAMAPVVRTFRKPSFPPNGWRMPKAIGVLVVYLLVSVILGLALYFVGSTLVAELTMLLTNLPDIAGNISNTLKQWASPLGLAGTVPDSGQVAAQARGYTDQALGALTYGTVFIGSIVDFVFRLFIVLTLALLFVVEGERFLGFFVWLFPSRHQEKVRSVMGQIGSKIGYWILGQLAVATAVGALAWLLAMLLGLPYPVLFGVITASLDLAPVVGSSLMVIPASLAGLSQSPVTAVIAGAAFLVLAEVDANVLSPLITGRAVRLSPALIVAALPFGLALYGAVGAFIAVPVAASLQIIAREILIPWLKDHERKQEGEQEDHTENGDRREKAA